MLNNVFNIQWNNLRLYMAFMLFQWLLAEFGDLKSPQVPVSYLFHIYYFLSTINMNQKAAQKLPPPCLHVAARPGYEHS